MRQARVAALRRERAEMLRFCRDLDDSEWRTDSRAAGWRVQDVLAHLGSGCRAAFTPALLTIMRSDAIEHTNDTFVEQRRDWPPSRTLAEYERSSKRLTTVAGAVARTPLRRIRLPLAELGRFPAGLLLAGAMTFDHHTHLRFDMAPAVDRPAPDTDPARMAVVLEWMFAVLTNQLRQGDIGWLSRPLAIVLDGPGGGTWYAQPGGTVTTTPEGSPAASITSRASEFPEWATRRADWRHRDVRISGDEEYGVRFLDALDIV